MLSRAYREGLKSFAMFAADVSQPRLAHLRRLTALICMVLTCMVCSQTTIVHVEMAIHATDTDHRADPTAGLVILDTDGAEKTRILADSPQPVSHTHVGEGTFEAVFMIGQIEYCLPSTSSRFAAARHLLHSGNIPDVQQRPPKSLIL